MLTISNLDFRVEARPLFEGASATISKGWKVGLVGRNGTGKSTLLRLIREDVENPSGDSSIRLSTGARLGWVAQEVAPGDETILDIVLACDEERAALMAEADIATDPNRIADIHRRLGASDAWAAEARAASRKLVASLRYTRARAIIDKSEQVFEVDVENRSYQAPGREQVSLPEGVDVTITTARSEV